MRVLGADNDSINQNLLLDIQMDEGSGTITRDWAKPHHVDPTLVGTPSWTNVSGLGVLDFNAGHPDYVRILAANSLDLNFTSGNFSGAVWIYSHLNLTNQWIMIRGNQNADGWYLMWQGNNNLAIVTNQAAARQETKTADTSLTVNTWIFVAFTRNGASCQLYQNGVDRTSVVATHINPLSNVARDTLIGVYTALTFPFDGYMYRPRIWSRALAPKEVNELFQRERGLFGV